MNQTAEAFRQFVGKLIEAEGGLAESLEPGGLDYLLAGEAASALQIPAEGRLGFGGELPEGALHLNLDPDWLGRLGKVLGGRGRYLVHRLNPVYNRQAFLESQLERALPLLNAVYRFRGTSPAWSRYLILTFRYSALSDDKREGMIRVGLNLSNGSPLDPILEGMLSALDWPAEALPEDWPPGPLPSLWEENRLQRWLEAGLVLRIERQLHPFLAGLRRRMNRDLARVQEYHQALLRESAARLKKHPEEEAREQSHQEAIRREYLAQGEDLRHKYALQVKVEWVQTLELIMPVERVEVLLKRRKGERLFHLDWNPLVRCLEPVPCEYSTDWEGPRLICDENLHLVCLSAHADCPRCGKPFCRACHRSSCPKCAAPVQAEKIR